MPNEDDSPTNTNSSHNTPKWPEDDNSNPFDAFRRFADEQISSMLQSVMGLPSIATTPQSDHWTVFNEQSDPYTTRQQDGNQPSNSNSRDSPESSSHQWSDYHRHRRADDFFGFGSFFDRFWLDDHLPLSSRIFPGRSHHSILGILDGDEDTPMWPVMYIMTSPYSPLQLERESRYRSHRKHDEGVFSSLMSSLKLNEPGSAADEYDRDPMEPEWRDAFEDLLRVKYGKPMLERETEAETEGAGKRLRRRQPEKDWLAGLVERGSLGEGWKYVPSQSGFWFSQSKPKQKDSLEQESETEIEREALKVDSGTVKDNEDFRHPQSELDMYEQFITDIETRERDFARQFHDSPILRFLSEERERHKAEIAAYRAKLAEKERNHNGDGDESWLDLVSGGEDKNSVPDSQIKSDSTIDTRDTQNQIQSRGQDRPISTNTTTERVRLADGSVHTKTVTTKRFADGREESNESVETSRDSSDSSASNWGWFWK